MDIKKAVITAAARSQRQLPLQTVVDRDGVSKSALRIILEECLQAGIDEIGIVICPGDQAAYRDAAGDLAGRLRFVEQKEPLGYGHAVHEARAFTGDQPFLLLVGDHLYLSNTAQRCAQQLVAIAASENCAVSAVQSTHESNLPHYGTIGGRLVAGRERLYQVEEVLEKPTPTEAEQRLIVPGQRAGHYLCFFGLHVLTPLVMELLSQNLRRGASKADFQLSSALAQLPGRERYLACELQGLRYDIGARYGLLTAQMALALHGADREEILNTLVELLAQRPR